MVAISSKNAVVVPLSEVRGKVVSLPAADIMFILSKPLFSNDQVLGVGIDKNHENITVTIEYLNLYEWREIEPWANRVIKDTLR